MTVTEKIFAMHDVSRRGLRRGYVKPGDIIQVDIDWILASELSWAGMERVYDSVGKPGIFRNDRFWLAGDHRVEPPLYDNPKVKALMKSSRRAEKDFKMTDFQGFNEFGAITGTFETDSRTVEFINKRRMKKHKGDAVYFKADDDAVYAETFEVNLTEVEPFVAIHPSPDNVVPISETSDVELDGCFIGACTTAEEDLMTGALVLSAGLERGMIPVQHGRRLVVPGSRPIRHKLEKFGLLDVYKRAGLKIGVPGCSMCVGQGVDQAAPGEKWMSSQNRNFKNRMGPGSLAYLGSAATVAVSSFGMKITDPRELLDAIDFEYLAKCLHYQPFDEQKTDADVDVSYDEPYGEEVTPEVDNHVGQREEGLRASRQETESNQSTNVIRGKALVLGDFIDTDAIIPSKFLAGSTTDEEFGSHCMEFFMPEFREMVKNGFNIIVGGNGFGVGSSRDVAVNALLGAGVHCVIAKSFAFIYARNQPNIGLLGITVQDEDFYATATQGVEISVDVDNSIIRCGGKTFRFELSEMEKQLIAVGGLTEAFRKFGTNMLDALCRRKHVEQSRVVADIETIGFASGQA